VNTHGLPPEVVRECLLGFIETLTNSQAKQPAQASTFKEWIVGSLGEGIAKHFMVPFNEKLWQVPLDELTADWVSWLVPKPELKDVVNGALGIQDKAFGYNPSFLYPTQGGIQALPRAFLPAVSDIHYGTELLEVNTVRRRAVFRHAEHGERSEDYSTLVSTIPLPELVRRCMDLPRPIQEAAEGLRWVSVYNINLGIARERVSDKHWVYFPERDYPFYRAGFPMNFSPDLGQPGCSSLYVEMSHLPHAGEPPSQLVHLARQGLERAGILRSDDETVVADVKNIHYAYVLFDRHRAGAVPHILAELKRRGIHSIGRYGLWEHTSMEDAIAQGRSTAESLRALQAVA
jgi:protoporphyrinogen oxidase